MSARRPNGECQTSRTKVETRRELTQRFFVWIFARDSHLCHHTSGLSMDILLSMFSTQCALLRLFLWLHVTGQIRYSRRGHFILFKFEVICVRFVFVLALFSIDITRTMMWPSSVSIALGPSSSSPSHYRLPDPPLHLPTLVFVKIISNAFLSCLRVPKLLPFHSVLNQDHSVVIIPTSFLSIPIKMFFLSIHGEFVCSISTCAWF